MSAPSLRVQAVVYHNPVDRIERSLESIAAAGVLAQSRGALSRVIVHYGDAGQSPALEEDRVRELAARYEDVLDVRYTVFGENTGFGLGQNRLAEGASDDLLFIINPDVVLAPRCLALLAEVMARPEVGIADAKQIPIEHPKDYDTVTGETSWVSGACTVIGGALYSDLGGFDADSFHMYCEDVDLSWRVRERGLLAVHQSAAVVFHDKRIAPGRQWVPTETEVVHSARSALMLAYKWSRDDLVHEWLTDWPRYGLPHLDAAVREFARRRDEGNLPVQRDSAHRIGYFEGGRYAPHRYELIGGHDVER